jgi:hypothetical protein
MRISVDQTVTAGAYTAGMAVGGRIIFPNVVSQSPLKCAIVDALVIDKAGQQQPYDLAFFNADLVGTVTDRQTFNLHDSDRSKLLGFIPLVNTRTVGTGGVIIGATNIYKRLTLLSVNAYAVLIAAGTPTFTGIGDVTVLITAEQVWA